MIMHFCDFTESMFYKSHPLIAKMVSGKTENVLLLKNVVS